MTRSMRFLIVFGGEINFEVLHPPRALKSDVIEMFIELQNEKFM